MTFEQIVDYVKDHSWTWVAAALAVGFVAGAIVF